MISAAPGYIFSGMPLTRPWMHMGVPFSNFKSACALVLQQGAIDADFGTYVTCMQ